MLLGDTVIMLLARLWGWVGLEIPLVPSPDGEEEISIYFPICETGGGGGGTKVARRLARVGSLALSRERAFLLPPPSLPSQLLQGVGI